jgi:urease accessory protein UreF
MKHEGPDRAEVLERNEPSAHVTLEFLNGWSGLAEQMGTTGDLGPTARAASFSFPRPDSLAGLRSFLEKYHSEMLVSRELPVICQAYRHACRNEARELIVLDAQLGREPNFQPFAEASRNIGAAHLKRLRPLRDQRVVQRYLQAVETGEACGCHTIVYGVILAVYSLPLRQGLLHYSHEAMRGFIASANSSLCLVESQIKQLHDELSLPLPQAVEAVLARMNCSVG